MADDSYRECMRVVGGINALNELAKATQCLRADRLTVSYLDQARALINKALLSSWEYADSQADGGSEHG